MKKLMLLIAVGMSFAAFATNYTWTGDVCNGLWTLPRNWNLNVGYPSNADDEVTFAKSGDVNGSLDTVSQTDISYSNVTVGNVVLTTISGTEADPPRTDVANRRPHDWRTRQDGHRQ